MNPTNNWLSHRISRRSLTEGALAVLLTGSRELAMARENEGLRGISLSVADVNLSRDFYRDILGVPLLTENSTEAVLALPEVQLILQKGLRDETNDRGDNSQDASAINPSGHHYAFQVASLNSKENLLRCNNILYRQITIPESRTYQEIPQLFFKDPDGNLIELTEGALPRGASATKLLQGNRVRLHHVSRSVSQVFLQETERLYCSALGMKPVIRPDTLGSGAWYSWGSHEVHLIARRESQTAPQVKPYTWQIHSCRPEKLLARLQRHGISGRVVSTGNSEHFRFSDRCQQLICLSLSGPRADPV